MSGAIFAVVGPSGVGKDTLLKVAKREFPDLYLVRRVITRPEAAGGEAFESVSEDEFSRRMAVGDFALHWRAHGLGYGIPASVHEVLAGGGQVVFNGSRAMLRDAARVFPGLRVIHVTASEAVLAARLGARRRETEQDIAARLERAKLPLPEGLDISEIDNSGALEDAVAEMTRLLQPESIKA